MNEEITPELILHGYRVGVFPMADERGRIAWYSPDPRCVFDYEHFRVPRSVRQMVRRGLFEVRIDTAFADVIAACADRPEGTWISDELSSLYCELHRAGHVHSVECWQNGELAGGLYGVAIGGGFFGESMFHWVSGASKVALVALIERLKRRGYALIDTQWYTAHLAQFGAREVPREEYMARLARAIELTCTFADEPAET